MGRTAGPLDRPSGLRDFDVSILHAKETPRTANRLLSGFGLKCCVSFRARAEKRERSVAHVEFRSGGAAVDVDQICFRLAPAPSFLRGICSIPSFVIAKFAAIV